MKHAGRKLGILCLSLIGTLLLSSCTYTLQEAPQSLNRSSKSRQ